MGPCFWLRGSSHSCAMGKKKETVFLLGGLFGKTAALPTAASLQRASKECSPLLSLNPSIPPNEQLPLVCRNISPASPRPRSFQPHRRKAAVGVALGFMGNVQSRNPQSTHTHSKQHSLGTLTSQHISHVFLISVTSQHGLNPVTKLKNLLLCLPRRGCGCYSFLRRILTAHVGGNVSRI